MITCIAYKFDFIAPCMHDMICFCLPPEPVMNRVDFCMMTLPYFLLGLFDKTTTNPNGSASVTTSAVTTSQKSNQSDNINTDPTNLTTVSIDTSSSLSTNTAFAQTTPSSDKSTEDNPRHNVSSLGPSLSSTASMVMSSTVSEYSTSSAYQYSSDELTTTHMTIDALSSSETSRTGDQLTSTQQNTHVTETQNLSTRDPSVTSVGITQSSTDTMSSNYHQQPSSFSYTTDSLIDATSEQSSANTETTANPASVMSTGAYLTSSTYTDRGTPTNTATTSNSTLQPDTSSTINLTNTSTSVSAAIKTDHKSTLEYESSSDSTVSTTSNVLPLSSYVTFIATHSSHGPTVSESAATTRDSATSAQFTDMSTTMTAVDEQSLSISITDATSTNAMTPTYEGTSVTFLPTGSLTSGATSPTEYTTKPDITSTVQQTFTSEVHISSETSGQESNPTLVAGTNIMPSVTSEDGTSLPPTTADPNSIYTKRDIETTTNDISTEIDVTMSFSERSTPADRKKILFVSWGLKYPQPYLTNYLTNFISWHASVFT